RTVLFDELGLQPQKKTKTGFSTDAASLEKLRGQHEVVDSLLRYREVEKLRSTYGDSLLAEVGDDGRIHATFNQTVARTGRLSSDRPNLHNAPIRTAYFEAFPNVRDYMERTVAEARDRGYTETLFGRRRQIPELSSSNFRIRQAGERQAMNAGIQGLAADIFKVALVRLDRALED